MFLEEALPVRFRQTRKPRGPPIVNCSNPCLRVWPETPSIALIEIKVEKKGVILLQNDALIAFLIIEGREAVFRKACDELCHVVGSEKTRNRNLHSQKAKEKDSGALHGFQTKP